MRLLENEATGVRCRSNAAAKRRTLVKKLSRCHNNTIKALLLMSAMPWGKLSFHRTVTVMKGR